MGTLQKRRIWKETILTKAMEMFREQGIRAVRMDDIAASLRMSKRTLYEVYDNKHELLTDVLLRMKDESRADMQAFSENCESVMDILLYFFRRQAEIYTTTNPSFFTDLNRYPDLLERLREEGKKNESETIAFFSRGLEEGYFVPQVNYTLFLSMGSNVMKDLRVNPQYKGYDLKVIFNSVIYVLVRGICTAKGIARLDEFVSEL